MTSVTALTLMVNLSLVGISYAAVTRVGNLVGSRRYAQAQLSAWLACGLGAVVMGLTAITFASLRFWLPTLYTREDDVVLVCATILPIAATFQVFDGVQVVGAGVLRGMGETLPAAGFNLLGYWLLALPIGWWLAFSRADTSSAKP